ncbi:hypothetical protein [Streptomyces sp. NPDC045470]|uniref:hypothetical protein n=1 Tax=Streptomyces sp. NPDC045470 TaxID=3155469 RepID=UPI0033E4BAD1
MTVSTRIRTTLEQLGRMGPVDGLEIPFSAAADAVCHVSLSVFRFDDDAFVTPQRERGVGVVGPAIDSRLALLE